jgi:hypothetical protein
VACRRTPIPSWVDPSLPRVRRRALAVAAAILLLAGSLGALRGTDAPLPVPAARAVALGAHEPTLRALVATASSSRVTRIDDDLVKVTWFRGSRAIATIGVQRSGALTHPSRLSHVRTGYGAPLSHLPVLLAALTLLFLLAVVRGPLARMRTLDAAALAALVVPTILIDRGYLGPGEAIAAVLLLYLAGRGVAVAVHGTGEDPDAAPQPVALERLAARLRAPGLPRQLALALLSITVVVSLTSTGVVDIAWANMEGATLLTHGTLPYGHMPGDVIHGDTYGLPIYLAYAPLAAIWPVADDWTDAFGALVVGALAAGVCAAGLARATDPRAGRWSATLALLAFPPALMTFSSGTNDVLIAAAVIWAFVWFTRPALSSALLMAAGLAKVAPLILMPLWLARLRGAALVRAVAACAAVSALTLGALVALGGLHAPLDMVHAMSFQASRRSVASIWTSLGLEPLQPFAQAAALAVALGGAVLVLGDRALAADPRRVAGLVGAALALLQLAANHWTPLYLLWLVPPAAVALLGPLGARADQLPARRVSPAMTPGSEGAVA